MSMQEEVLQDLQEQVGKLTALLEDERRSYQHSCQAVRSHSQLLNEAERRAERSMQQHQLEIVQLREAHRSEVSKLVAAHISALEEEKSNAEERYALLEKDYDFLKSCFRSYKESVFEEMQTNWLKKETVWKEEQEDSLMKQLSFYNERLQEGEEEREQQRHCFQAELIKLHDSSKAKVEPCHFSELGKDPLQQAPKETNELE